MTLEEQYSPAGDTFWAIEARYGMAAADSVYAAARSGNTNTVNAELSNIRRGTSNADYQGSTSTFWNFGAQLATDPLAAPLDAANTALANSVASVFRNPFVLLALVVGVFFWLGGPKRFFP